MPSSASSGRSSGKVTPLEDEVNQQPAQLAAEHALGNGNMTLMMSDAPVEASQPVVPASFLSRLFKKKQAKEEQKPVPKKEPEAPKLKLFEIVSVLQRPFKLHSANFS